MKLKLAALSILAGAMISSALASSVHTLPTPLTFNITGDVVPSNPTDIAAQMLVPNSNFHLTYDLNTKKFENTTIPAAIKVAVPTGATDVEVSVVIPTYKDTDNTNHSTTIKIDGTTIPTNGTYTAIGLTADSAYHSYPMTVGLNTAFSGNNAEHVHIQGNLNIRATY